jgi:hypothetical protein
MEYCFFFALCLLLPSCSRKREAPMRQSADGPMAQVSALQKKSHKLRTGVARKIPEGQQENPIASSAQARHTSTTDPRL